MSSLVFSLFALACLFASVAVNAQTSQADLCECLISPVTLKIPNLNQTYGGNANALNGQATWVFVDDTTNDAFVQHNISLKICPTTTASNGLTQYIDKLRIRVAVNQTIVFQQTVSITQQAVSTSTYCFTGFASFIDAGGSANMPRITVANPPVFYVLDDRSVAYAVMGINAQEEVVQSVAPVTPAVPPSSTTDTPTTAAPTTSAPTSGATTQVPTTAAPTSGATTQAPTTAAPTSSATTHAPTTGAPTSSVTTQAPTTSAPTSGTTTQAPTTSAPTSGTTTQAPTTSAPTSGTTTQAPTTAAPTSGTTTAAPTTVTPTTAAPTTPAPTTAAPTTAAPTTPAPTTAAPTTPAPTTPVPTTTAPTTPVPTTAAPTSTPAPTPVWQLSFNTGNVATIAGSGSGTIATPTFTSGNSAATATDSQISGQYVFSRVDNNNGNTPGGYFTVVSNFNSVGIWSKACWVKLSRTGTSSNNLVSAATVTSNTGHFFYTPTGNGVFTENGPNLASPLTFSGNTAVSLNTWTHFVITGSAANGYTLYRNGVIVSSVSATAYAQDTSGFLIGAVNGGLYGLDGLLWKPAYYDIEMTAAQVKATYNTQCALITGCTQAP